MDDTPDMDYDVCRRRIVAEEVPRSRVVVVCGVIVIRVLCLCGTVRTHTYRIRETIYYLEILVRDPVDITIRGYVLEGIFALEVCWRKRRK